MTGRDDQIGGGGPGRGPIEINGEDAPARQTLEPTQRRDGAAAGGERNIGPGRRERRRVARVGGAIRREQAEEGAGRETTQVRRRAQGGCDAQRLRLMTGAPVGQNADVEPGRRLGDKRIGRRQMKATLRIS